MDETISQNITTEFNSSLSRLESLNRLLDDCNKYSRLCFTQGYQIEYLKLFKTTLLAIRAEIIPKLKSKKEQDKIKSLFKNKNIGKVITTERTRSGLIKKLHTKKFHQHWKELNKINEGLRILADNKGMLIKDKPDEAGSALQ